jgi:hypothetical protein
MDTLKMKPIPEDERITVLALLRACYLGNDVDKMPPGHAPDPDPRPTVRAGLALVRKTA